MSRRPFFRLATGLAAVAWLSIPSLQVQAGGGCGCEYAAPTSAVYHVHQRCGHCCRATPPVGMLVPSAPMMMSAAPMMSAPMMAPVQMAPVMAPVMSAPVMQVAAAPVAMAPLQTVTVAQAPTQQFQLSLVPASAPAAAPTNCGGDQLRAAVLQALQNSSSSSSSSPSSALSAPSSNVESQLNELEKRVSSLEKDTQDIQAKAQQILDALRDIKNNK